MRCKDFAESTDERAIQGIEPTNDEVQKYMEISGENFYNARELLRNLAYGGTPPGGYTSWGDYWKGY